ncbi:hypothetical protein DVR12_26970 [Chitinophaga silvatica]|uniref:Uncharacterized protein n=1 Tax=Chitinophaga silvatica TaxID=2282649 RepID=A0A3E1Y1X1_9BACT|nr:hypothetical protein [Chitinophaga silvatica]RFS18690.1 hypothetical protein DVR12_26970 [Chitinophaga silvatica]
MRLYLNIDKPLEVVAEIVFKKAFGISVIDEGDSLNVVGGIYYRVTFLGVDLRLEPNDFECNDLYNYVLFIRYNPVGGLRVNETDIRHIAISVLSCWPIKI